MSDQLFKIRNKLTGAWVCYGDMTSELETHDRAIADDLVDELLDYNIEAEVVEVTEP